MFWNGSDEACEDSSRSASKRRLAFRIGRVIWRLREQSGMTQEKLAGRAGIAQSTLSLIERGKRDASIDALSVIASALHIKLATIIAFAENPSRGFSDLVAEFSDVLESSHLSRNDEPDEDSAIAGKPQLIDFPRDGQKR